MRRGYDYNSYYYHPPPQQQQQQQQQQKESYTTPRYPDVPKFFLLNKFMSKEAAAPDQPLQAHHDHHNTSNKKKEVQFKSEKKVEVINDNDNDNNNNRSPIPKDSTIDEAADGYIQQRHKKFELAKWRTTFNTTNNKDTTT